MFEGFPEEITGGISVRISEEVFRLFLDQFQREYLDEFLENTWMMSRGILFDILDISGDIPEGIPERTPDKTYAAVLEEFLEDLPEKILRKLWKYS